MNILVRCACGHETTLSVVERELHELLGMGRCPRCGKGVTSDEVTVLDEGAPSDGT